MKKYVYQGAKPFYFYDTCVATFGDTLVVDGNHIQNVTHEILLDNFEDNQMKLILSHCIEINDLEDEDNDLVSEDKEDLISVTKKNKDIILALIRLGVLDAHDSCRDYNVGESDYSKHIIQPWSIWLDWNLNPWDADIIKRVLRTKGSRKEDYEKIIHICKERIRQLNTKITDNYIPIYGGIFRK